jgi:hypothetical protein
LAFEHEGMDSGALAFRRLLILVLAAALAFFIGVALWHFVTWLLSGRPFIECVNPDVNCGPG